MYGKGRGRRSARRWPKAIAACRTCMLQAKRAKMGQQGNSMACHSHGCPSFAMLAAKSVRDTLSRTRHQACASSSQTHVRPRSGRSEAWQGPVRRSRVSLCPGFIRPSSPCGPARSGRPAPCRGGRPAAAPPLLHVATHAAAGLQPCPVAGRCRGHEAHDARHRLVALQAVRWMRRSCCCAGGVAACFEAFGRGRTAARQGP